MTVIDRTVVEVIRRCATSRWKLPHQPAKLLRMLTHIEAHLRFHSKTALARGEKAFKDQAPDEFITWHDLQVHELVVSLQRSVEVEADLALWPALEALAHEANEGFVVFDEGTDGAGALRVLLSEGEGQRRRWVAHACAPKTPSAEMRLDQVVAKKRALGLAVGVAQRFDVWVHQAPRMMDAIKALRAALKMEIGEAKALLAELPARVARRVDQDAAKEACAALEAAGITVERVVSA